MLSIAHVLCRKSVKHLLLCFILSFFPSNVITLANAAQLRVVTESLPPYQIVENGKLLGGSSYLLMQETLKRAGFTSKFEVLPWARAYQVALTEENVIIFSIVRSPKRENLFKWIGKFNEKSYSFYTSSTRPELRILSIQDALNYTVVAVRDSYEQGVLIALGFEPGKNLMLTLDYVTEASMVQLGRADIILQTPIIESHNAHAPQGNIFVKQPFEVVTSALYVAASQRTPDDIVAKLSDAFKSAKHDLSLDAAQAKVESTNPIQTPE
jgi:polar amino acid transport system substrate-binding protein